MKETALRSEIELLRIETAKLLAAKLDGGLNQGHGMSALGTFSSAAASKAVNEKVMKELIIPFVFHITHHYQILLRNYR